MLGLPPAPIIPIPAALAKPVTWLADIAGRPGYVVTGLFWLPVVWIQVRLRDLARAAATAGEPLPPEYFRLYHIWFACGFPAFFAVIASSG